MATVHSVVFMRLSFIVLALSMTSNADTTVLANSNVRNQTYRNGHSANQNKSNQLTRFTDTSDGQAAVEQKRNANGALRSYLRSLVISREKVPPEKFDPSGNPSLKLDVFFKMYMVYDVDDTRQTLRMGIFMEIRWLDLALAWNPSDYSGVTYVDLPLDAVWTPKVLLVNSIDVYDVFSHVNSLNINSSGSVFAQMPIFTETTCLLELTYYPYDEQFCPVYVYVFSPNASWNFVDNSKIEQLSTMLEFSSEWDLVSVSQRVEDLAGEKMVRYMLHLRRKTLFYSMFVVSPIVVTSYLNTLVFLIPPQSGEKVSFLVSIFLSTAVFLGFFTDVMPRGLDCIPNIVKLLIGVTTENIVIFLASIYILRRFHGDAEKEEEFRQTGSDKVQSDRREPMRTTAKTGVLTSRLCCRGRSHASVCPVVHVPANVTSPPAEKELRATISESGGHSSRKLTVPRLDWWCFVVAFVGNSIFLSSILAYSLSSKSVQNKV